ncbi:hypothetical protein PM082_014046 [Marasmius tenuissimus]|nr:hypothetical protein PM082_014046 [Marasmius tenuissimus]
MNSGSPSSQEQLHHVANQQKQILIFIAALHALAVLSTIFRLARRIRIKRLSWDDAWAVVATFFSMIFLITGWVNWELASKKQRNRGPLINRPGFGVTEIVVAALMAASTWASRISLSLSIFRILPTGRLRTIVLAFSIGCFFVGPTIVIYHATMLYSTRNETHWPAWRRWKVAGPQVIADVLCSLFLVALPLYALRKMTSLPKSERRIILILFGSTLLSLGAGCGEVVATARANAEIGLVYAANIEAAVGLMVCNSLVIVTALLRLRVSRRGTLGSPHGTGVMRGHTRPPSEEREQEYNSGEDQINLEGTQGATGRRTAASRSSESQLTGFDETQTYSYILESLSERTENPASGSKHTLFHDDSGETSKRSS